MVVRVVGAGSRADPEPLSDDVRLRMRRQSGRGCSSAPSHGLGSRAQWRRDKLDANVERDRRNTAALRDRGWTVLRFWEHEAVDEVTAQIVGVLAGADVSGAPST